MALAVVGMKVVDAAYSMPCACASATGRTKDASRRAHWRLLQIFGVSKAMTRHTPPGNLVGQAETTPMSCSTGQQGRPSVTFLDQRDEVGGSLTLAHAPAVGSSSRITLARRHK